MHRKALNITWGSRLRTKAIGSGMEMCYFQNKLMSNAKKTQVSTKPSG